MPDNCPNKDNMRTLRKPSGAVTVLAKAEVENIRYEELQGVEHMIVPIVALKEGVIHPGNVAKPEFAPATAFGAVPTAWNGRPVTLSHPQRKGMMVSASQSPKVFEEEALGFLFNTKLSGKKLKTEAWINLSKVEQIGGEVEEQIKRLESGEMVEVSTGLFATVDPVEGKFNGKEYFGIWSHVIPDHLAILRDNEVGACSVEDGCGGPRTNHKHCKCEGACGECKEKNMPKVNNLPAEDMSDDDEPGTEPETLHEDPEGEDDKGHPIANFLKGLRDNFAGVFRFKNNAELSDVDRRRALFSALSQEEDNYYDIVAVFEDSFVYAKGFDGKLKSRGFTISEEGPVTLGEEVTEVRPVTEFVPVNSKEENMPTTNSLVDELIANSATQFTEDDRQWLSELPEERLNKMTPTVNTENDSEEEEEQPAADPAPAVNSAATPEDFISQAPKEIQEVLQEGLRMQSEARQKLVKELMDSGRCDFTEAQLKDMSTSQLRSMAKLANVPSFEGRAGQPRTNAAPETDENKAPPAPKALVAAE